MTNDNKKYFAGFRGAFLGESFTPIPTELEQAYENSKTDPEFARN
jgi:tryptophan synthase beta subunit